MFFPKRIKSTPEKKHKVSLSLDFNKYRGDFLKQRNVKRVGNNLLSTFSFKDPLYFVYITRAVFSKGGYLVALMRDLGLYTLNSKKPISSIIPKKMDDCVISHVEYQDKTVFSCSNGTYSLTDDITVGLLTKSYYPSLAVCYDRIFGVNGNELCMTAAGDISHWDASNKITAHTQLDAVVALDKIYVLGDTCYTLTPSAEDIDLKFAPFSYGTGTVQTDSVATFGKRAIFATTKGLYELKSTAITPIFSELNDYVSFDGCVACSFEGKYYVTCKRKDGDMSCNDVLLVLDVDSEQICGVFDVKMQHISAIDGRLYAVCEDVLYYSADIDTESSYSQTVDFGCSDVKYLDKLTIRSYSDVDVWISNGSEKRRYCIKGKNTLQSVPLAGSGRQFCVEVQAQKNMNLNSIELFAHSYEV